MKNDIQSRLKHIANGVRLMSETMKLFANMMEGIANSVEELAEVGEFGEEE
jgi:prophage DNA circulation protein